MTNENGLAVEEIGYLPFGAKLFRNVDNGGGWESVYKFTDQEYDAEYELYNYKARLYDPTMCRFITADTIIPDYNNPQSLNRYAYCYNNPLKYTDPSGHFANLLLGAGLGGAIGAGSAWLQGKSGTEIAAAAFGGAVTGALIASGVGAFAAGATSAGLSGTVTAGGVGLITGSSAVVGNTVEQVAEGVMKGKSLSTATVNVSYEEQVNALGAGIVAGAAAKGVSNAMAGNSANLEGGLNSMKNTLANSASPTQQIGMAEAIHATAKTNANMILATESSTGIITSLVEEVVPISIELDEEEEAEEE